jgi:hypothetical protein
MSVTLAPPFPETADPPTPLPPDRGRALVARLFAGDFPFPAVPPAPLTVGDCHPAEHDAVARALGCRDLFVVAAADADPRERAVASLARAAADRGERVLVLSPDPAAADRIAERVGANVLRALAADENPYRLSVAASRLTSNETGPGRVEQLRRETAAAIAELEAARERAGQRAKLEAEAAALDAAVRAEVDAALAAEVGPARAELAARHEAAAKAKSEKAAAAAAVRQQLAEAGKKGGFLSRLFKAKPAGPDPAGLEKQLHDLEHEVTELTARADALAAELAAADARLAADRGKRFAEALAARRADLDARLAALPPAPADADDQLAAAREVLAALTRDPAGAARRLLAAAAVVVGVPASLDADPVFEAAPPDGSPPFGLLVLDHAEELTEPDFLGLARLADRWVLAGDVPDGNPHRNGVPRRVDSFFGRLARALDRERFAAEGNRLVCRLTHVTPERRRALTREPLLDRPDVELRFVTDESGEPVLAEIAFPGSTPAADAKRLLARELGAVLLRPCGDVHRNLTAAEPHVRWPAADAGPAEWVDLAPGVREKVAGAYTAAVVFDPAHGWDAARAEAWLAEHLPPAPGRVAVLPRALLPMPRPVAVGS